MTDGVLLREIQQDFLLRKYNVLVLDEAHERGLNTDVLIGLLSRIVPLRWKLAAEHSARSTRGKRKKKKRRRTGHDSESKEETVLPDGQTAPVTPLRLVIMSATLRIEDFVGNRLLFPTPPKVLNVESRQFPVTVHFSRRTVLTGWQREVYKKVCQIHTRLPAGHILVFLTGRREIEDLCRRLADKFRHAAGSMQRETTAVAADSKSDATGGSAPVNEDSEVYRFDDEEDSEIEQLDDVSDAAGDTDSEQEAGAAPMDEEEDEDDEIGAAAASRAAPVRVMPLYSLLSTQRQLAVFQPVPDGTRLIVVATNVAETSLTIPGVKYVVDCGRDKQRVYDRATGKPAPQFCCVDATDTHSLQAPRSFPLAGFLRSIVDLLLYRVSAGVDLQASAAQRSGRAGRTGPGHAYRLYSSAVFDNYFAKHSAPEILRRPIEGTVLQMKTMSIDDVASFPFPTPPDSVGLRSAVRTLEILGALDRKHQRITALGRTLAAFPLAPRYSRCLLLAHQGHCLPYMVAVVASLTVEHLAEPDPRGNQQQPALSEEHARIQESDSDEEREAHTRQTARERKEAAEQQRRAELESRRQLSKALEASRWRWRHPDSDLLTNLRIVGGSDHAGDTAEFCKRCVQLRFRAVGVR